MMRPTDNTAALTVSSLTAGTIYDRSANALALAGLLLISLIIIVIVDPGGVR